MYRRPRQNTYRRSSGYPGRQRSFSKARLLIMLAFAAFAVFNFMRSKQVNEVTGEEQYISLTESQEIQLGLQATPELIQQFGGLYQNQELQDYVDEVGFFLVNQSVARNTDWQFEFHLLDDPKTVNAFALPGGQVFITTAMYERLETEGQLAGVLGHEIGHVLARHGAQRMAKAQLTQGLTQAVLIGADPNSAQFAQMIGQMVNMKYGRDDELESDRLGVQIMSDSGYDPRAMIGVMEILAEASGGGAPPEFFSSHPNPDNRIGKIQEAINRVFPDGVPEGLVP